MTIETKMDPLAASFAAMEEAPHEEAVAEVETVAEPEQSPAEKVAEHIAAVRRWMDAHTVAAARPALEGTKSMPRGEGDFTARYLRRGLETGLERKSFDGTTGPAGGYAIPQEIDAVIDRTLNDISPIRSIANVVKVGSAGYRKLVTTGGTAN
jgi:HK97 family phage major capsid protein